MNDVPEKEKEGKEGGIAVERGLSECRIEMRHSRGDRAREERNGAEGEVERNKVSERGRKEGGKERSIVEEREGMNEGEKE